MNSSPSSSSIPRFLIEIAELGSADELAWHLRTGNFVHDPDCEELVRRACCGNGENSQLLQAMVGPSDGPDWEPVAISKAPARLPAPVNPFKDRVRRVGKLKKNPFAPPKAVHRTTPRSAQPFQRSAVLMDEPARLYRCMAFAMRMYGVVMNGHMTVCWKQLGVHDHVQAAAILTEFNNRMRKWLKVNATGRKRKGTTASAWGEPEQYFYAFIHEHVPHRGFHTHQLFGVTDGKCKAFAEYAVMVLQELAGVKKAPVDAVHFTPGTKRDGFAPYLPSFKKNEIERSWVWFKYLAKNLSPHMFMTVKDQCAAQRDIFRIRRTFMMPLPVTCPDLFGCSENISVGIQRKVGFVSKLDRGDWKYLYTGSELSEHQFDVQKLEQEREMMDTLATLKI